MTAEIFLKCCQNNELSRENNKNVSDPQATNKTVKRPPDAQQATLKKMKLDKEEIQTH